MRWSAALVLTLVVVCACEVPRAPTRRRSLRDRREAMLARDTILLPDSLMGLDHPHQLLLNPANGHLYVSGLGPEAGVLVLDAASGRRVGFIRGSAARSMWLNPLTNRLYIEAERWDSRRLLVVDCTADTVVHRIENSRLRPVCVNLADNKVYGLFDDYWHTKVAIIDSRTSRILNTVTLGPAGKWGAEVLLWNPTSNTVYCTEANTGAIVVIDGRTDHEITRIRHRENLWVKCINAKDNKLYAESPGSDDSSLAVIDCHTNRVVAWLPGLCGIERMVYSPKENKVYCSTRDGIGAQMNGVVVLDGTSDSVLRRIPTPGEPCEMLYDSANNRIYCFGYCTGWVTAVDCRGDSIVAVVRAGQNMSPAAHHAPTNRLYCLDWRPKALYVVDCATFAVIETIALGYRR